ncbi:hypothetical protein T484DRAFT_1877680 [Baffinella frigidus]|nr:hypothetical protein T484DRAFT_1877680 [Cryptophyta sp. CCMP2293]
MGLAGLLWGGRRRDNSPLGSSVPALMGLAGLYHHEGGDEGPTPSRQLEASRQLMSVATGRLKLPGRLPGQDVFAPASRDASQTFVDTFINEFTSMFAPNMIKKIKGWATRARKNSAINIEFGPVGGVGAHGQIHGQMGAQGGHRAHRPLSSKASLVQNRDAIQDVLVQKRDATRDALVQNRDVTRDASVQNRDVTREVSVQNRGVAREGSVQMMDVTRKGSVQMMDVTRKGSVQMMDVTRAGSVQMMDVTRDGSVQNRDETWGEEFPADEDEGAGAASGRGRSVNLRSLNVNLRTTSAEAGTPHVNLRSLEAVNLRSLEDVNLRTPEAVNLRSLEPPPATTADEQGSEKGWLPGRAPSFEDFDDEEEAGGRYQLSALTKAQQQRMPQRPPAIVIPEALVRRRSSVALSEHESASPLWKVATRRVEHQAATLSPGVRGGLRSDFGGQGGGVSQPAGPRLSRRRGGQEQKPVEGARQGREKTLAEEEAARTLLAKLAKLPRVKR